MTKTFSSDGRGNLISISNNQQGIINFQFDNDNNMVGAEVNGTNWTFRYNSQNQMYYSKIVDEYESVIDERFYIYDGLDCIAETETDGTILREYIRIGNTGGIVAEIRHNDTTCASGYQSGTFYYHYNHSGDVIAVSDSAGNLVFKADYDAYGKITRIDSGSFVPRYTFSTKRYFSELGLYYYGYRWYLPELGRWTTKDPIGFKGGTINVYEFCRNNPLFSIDEYGLCTKNKTGGFDFNENETKKIINQAAKNLLNESILKDLLDTFSQHGWGGTHDFKANGINNNYTVNGKILTADQFGNYLAGYATTMGFGPFGTAGVFSGGVVDGWKGNGPEFRWFDDKGSREMIWQGAKDAYKKVWKNRKNK